MSHNYDYKYYPVNPQAEDQKYGGLLEEDNQHPQNNAPVNESSSEKTTIVANNRIGTNQEQVPIVSPVQDISSVPVAEPVMNPVIYPNHTIPAQNQYQPPNHMISPQVYNYDPRLYNGTNNYPNQNIPTNNSYQYNNFPPQQTNYNYNNGMNNQQLQPIRQPQQARNRWLVTRLKIWLCVFAVKVAIITIVLLLIYNQ